MLFDPARQIPDYFCSWLSFSHLIIESVLYKPQFDNLSESPPRTGGEVAIVMPQMMMVQQDDYNTSRATAVENIERTIVELGGIFQQLASLVAQQGDMIQRYAYL